MATWNYRAGLQNVGSYQVSGRPYATGSIDALSPGVAGKIPYVVQFPKVTRWVVISNADETNTVRVGFSADGISGSTAGATHGGPYPNYFLRVPPGTMTQPLELKVTELWLSGSNDVDVMAGLTFIDVNAINNTAVSPGTGNETDGTNWTGSVGV
jgi:hypothetical protein